jgi:hypothetical protein
VAKKRRRTPEDEEFDRRAMANAQRLRDLAAGAAEREWREQQARKQRDG